MVKEAPTATVVLMLEFVDMATGETVGSVQAIGECQGGGINIGATDYKNGPSFNMVTDSSRPLGKATQLSIDDAAPKITSWMVHPPHRTEAKAVRVDVEGGVTQADINRGSSLGVEVGEEMSLAHPGEPIRDLDAREMLGTKAVIRLGGAASSPCRTPGRGTGHLRQRGGRKGRGALPRLCLGYLR
ncbi:MAG TPA: hypothetical protein VGM37_03345 [Armatimonadota bacterium]